MWRCKWLELQIKKFQSQAMKYDKELEKDHQSKQLKYKNFELEGLCAKSMPYMHDSHREKPFKRNKRKREEVDTKLYMSQHTVFSYFGTYLSSFSVFILRGNLSLNLLCTATKKSTTNGGATMDEDQTNPGNQSYSWLIFIMNFCKHLN